MENFIFQNNTKIIFGKNSENTAGKEIKPYGRKVLFHYGRESIKKTGLHERIIKSLQDEGIDFIELGGVQPNPVVSLIRRGIQLCRENNVDSILAVGGGSVIDSAKAISIGVYYDGDVWDFFENKAKPVRSLPIGVVLTIPASGSESSTVTVITNEDGLIKKGLHSDVFLPKFAILNPELSLTLPLFQIACGVSDILSHTFERYFTQTRNVDLTDRLCEGLIKTVMENAKLIIKNKPDYNNMAEIMWAGTLAHNGILGTGREEDWATHKFGHELSALYGITHGATLSVMFPAWMKYVYKYNIARFAQFTTRVFNIDDFYDDNEVLALRGIKELEKFYKELGLPIRLSELNTPFDRIEEMAEKITKNGPVGNFLKIYKEDAIKIYNLAK